MIYRHDGTFFRDPMNISAFINHARRIGNNGGPLPQLPNNNYQCISTNQTYDVPIGTANIQAKAVGLITCACVIYVSTWPNANAIAHLHHAPSGLITNRDINTALAALGNNIPMGSVYVIYAHPNAHDDGYQDSINTLINRNINTNNIIEICELNSGTFGVNNLGQIGI